MLFEACYLYDSRHDTNLFGDGNMLLSDDVDWKEVDRIRKYLTFYRRYEWYSLKEITDEEYDFIYNEFTN